MDVKELLEKMAKEIGRLQQLCKANGIDYIPPNMAPGATMGVSAEVKVFDSKEEADEYQKKFQ